MVELAWGAYVHVCLASELSTRDPVLIYRNKIKNSKIKIRYQKYLKMKFHNAKTLGSLYD
jgi:hypothetical protein